MNDDRLDAIIEAVAGPQQTSYRDRVAEEDREAFDYHASRYGERYAAQAIRPRAIQRIADAARPAADAVVESVLRGY